ncbi:hypothetical protein PHMEG_00023253, partial [Phytophthora megakarya]
EEDKCDDVAAPETRCRFNGAIDKTLLAEVLATPPFSANRNAVTGVWMGIASRLNQNLSTSLSFRSCRDRTSLLLRKYVVRKKRNEGTSLTNTSYDKVNILLKALGDRP